MSLMENLKSVDPEVAEQLDNELNRQRNKLELIASENIVSKAVLEAQGSVLTNKYAEGYPGKRYYGGCEFVDKVEQLAIDRAKKLFGAGYANVQPHSGAQANMAVFFALMKPGDTYMGMNLTDGGHLSHGSAANMSGKYFHVVPYGVARNTERIDYDEVERIANECHPTADEHPSPVPYADVVTTTTHKTLRGPRGGMILCKDPEFGKQFNKAVFPGIQGGPLMHVIAAKAVALGEALKPEFKQYAHQIRLNATALATELQAKGYRIVSGGTDNHLMLVDLTNKGITGKVAQNVLDEVNITANRNTIPFETLSPFVTSGLRLGSPALTTRGFKEDDMREVADIIALVLDDVENEAHKDEARRRVAALCAKYPLYE